MEAGIKDLVGVNPGLGAHVEIPEPDAGVHGEVAHQFEDGQGHDRDPVRHILGQGLAGQPRPAVDEHGAGAADGRPADKVEHQGGVQLLPEAIQGDEETHAHGFLQLILLHPGRNLGRGGVVPENRKSKESVGHFRLPLVDYLGAAGDASLGSE